MPEHSGGIQTTWHSHNVQELCQYLTLHTSAPRFSSSLSRKPPLITTLFHTSKLTPIADLTYNPRSHLNHPCKSIPRWYSPPPKLPLIPSIYLDNNQQQTHLNFACPHFRRKSCSNIQSSAKAHPLAPLVSTTIWRPTQKPNCQKVAEKSSAIRVNLRGLERLWAI